MRESPPRWPLVVALLMGATIGPYVDFARPAVLDVAVAVAALALPVLLSVTLDAAIPDRGAALAKVAVLTLVLGGRSSPMP